MLEKYADEDGRLNLQAFTRFMQQNTGSLQEAVRRRLPSLQREGSASDGLDENELSLE